MKCLDCGGKMRKVTELITKYSTEELKYPEFGKFTFQIIMQCVKCKRIDLLRIEKKETKK